MVNYQNGKIYKITAGELTYIGSTCEPTLARRLSGHVRQCKSWKNGNGNFVSSFPLIEAGKYQITLIELFQCNTKDELTARERFHILNTTCVNKQIPGRTQKEWHEEWYKANADKVHERNNKWYKANADKVRERQKAYIAANADTIRERQKAYYEARKAKSAESV